MIKIERARVQRFIQRAPAATQNTPDKTNCTNRILGGKELNDNGDDDEQAHRSELQVLQRIEVKRKKNHFVDVPNRISQTKV